ncbi:alpha/beta hydrolase [Nocardioides sp. TRM66260-LWL]|uniref:alpha/beta hydrolase fold domain-containing protein n=1 Tax=Nocardioides sp. TRM66260-LWL TaxID=2874478 RepID=UPI001CC60256|nr:alpha/beta hydrolase fold domain-containing protein [Nocardioides sp. TRM66260-LWL]MBZ5735488.1 alpha/beta hydrolase [Nocardioides sp. TRM66260-LWL]
MTMHALARFTVRYGAELRFAGQDLPRPRRERVPTRYGAVPVDVYSPPAGSPGAGERAHVHFHGGAWLMRYPRMDDWWCRYLAATAGVEVWNVDFRTGPYVAYPVAQHECHDVASVVARRRAAVSVGGFSSGGGLAASVCLQARDAGSFTPRLQVLGVPALDLATDVPAAPGMISPSLRALVRRVYFPDPATRAHPYASPVLAPDLAGLPPAVVLTAERDTLRRDGDAYARRLAEAGVEVVHDVTPGVDHYFLTEDPTRARTTMAMVAGEVARRLA